MSEIAEKLAELRKKILLPTARITVREWADKYRYLSPESSSKAGRWKTSQVEVSRGVMDAYSDPLVYQITVVSCTQLLKTEFINNCAGYQITEDPCPMLTVQPNEKLGNAWIKDRFDPMCRDTPILAGKVRGTINHKAFAGGILAVAGSNSPSDLSMRTIKVAFCDEIDKYPDSVGREGDSISLIKARQASFWDRKLVLVCSPTIEGSSRIVAEYEQSDKRRFFVPCHKCDHCQVMKWEQVKWEKKKPATAKYHCVKCNEAWSESHRIKNIKRGKWHATAEFKGHAGFHTSKLNSPWESMPMIAKNFMDAQKSREKMKVFTNTQLAEVWRDYVEITNWQKIYDRRENYEIGTVPRGGLILTIGADVQKDRVELEIVAWGRNLQTWSVDYIIIKLSIDSDDCKSQLQEIFNRKYKCDSGEYLKPAMAAIDTGYNSQSVYEFTRLNKKKIMAIKGVAGASKPILSTPRFLDISNTGGKVKGGVSLWCIGVHAAKDEFFEKLNLKSTKNNGYCHYPNYTAEYFKMLCSETLIAQKNKLGYDVYVYKKTRQRNEALDCRVYARAAAAALGIDKYQEKHWRKLERLTKNELQPAGQTESD